MSLRGATVKSGTGPETLEYTFGPAGTYVISYRDFKDGHPTACGTATVTVKSPPALTTK